MTTFYFRCLNCFSRIKESKDRAIKKEILSRHCEKAFKIIFKIFGIHFFSTFPCFKLKLDLFHKFIFGIFPHLKF